MLLAASIALAATSAQADIIAPDDVSMNEYGEVAESLTGQPGNPERGLEIIVSRSEGNCISCHAATALAEYPWHGEVGPSFDGAGARWDQAALRGILVNADVMFPDSVMPSFYRVSGFIRPGEGYTTRAPEGPLDPLLSAQDVEDVVAYLMTLTEY
jgi:sulfur-oxidizing protein SoxX